MSRALIEKIIENIELAPDIHKMTIKSEYISKNAKPGQFVNIKCCEGISNILRRPISICERNKETGSITIIYQKRGAGTEFLSKLKKGDSIDLVGPLGNGFDVFDEHKKIAVIGGGIGIFPLFFLLKEIKNVDKSAFLGFRSKEYAVLLEEYKHQVNNLYISTDDGSLEYKGLITDLLESSIIQEKYDIIYTCGPWQMMQKVTQLASNVGVMCQVSLEQRMGCGIGACLACACKIKIKNNNNQNDDWQYKRVCKDGPVFLGEEVIFNE